MMGSFASDVLPKQGFGPGARAPTVLRSHVPAHCVSAALQNFSAAGRGSAMAALAGRSLQHVAVTVLAGHGNLF